jgi:DNA-directed RNA polymerase subunit RPC12/RpoP
MRGIVVDCLTCGHHASIAQDDLPLYGLEPRTSLVTITKRFVCRQCGSRAVRAYREDDGPAAWRRAMRSAVYGRTSRVLALAGGDRSSTRERPAVQGVT